MAFTKIDEDIILHGGVTPLPDSPQLQPAALKAKFDEKGDAACNGFNNFIDEISTPATGAKNIGAEVPTGVTAPANVQGLINVLATLAVACEDERHWHENKTALDEITGTFLENVTGLVETLGSVDSIATESLNPGSTTEIPASSAVAAYFSGKRNDILGYVFPIGSIVFTINNMDPANLYNFGVWGIVDTVKTMTAWVRTA